jgi:hypothetical protein
VRFDESFHDNRRSWLTGKVDNEFAKGELSVGPDRYRFDIQSKKSLIYTSVNRLVSVKMASGFYLATDAQKVQGPDDASYGLVFLAQQHPDKLRDYYYFEVRARDFRFSVRSKGQWRIIIDWTRSSLIEPSQLNTLAVLAQGSRFTFFINGTYVDDIEDTELTEGNFGVGVELWHDGDAGRYEFNHLEVRTPVLS